MSKSNFDGKEYGNEVRTFNSVRHYSLNKTLHLDSSVLTLVMWKKYFKPHYTEMPQIVKYNFLYLFFTL